MVGSSYCRRCGRCGDAGRCLPEAIGGYMVLIGTAHVPEANEMLQMQQPRAVAETLAAFFARHPLS